MTTLFNATLQLAQRLKVLRTSTATNGSTTTIVDSKRTESDDAFNGGSVFIITDAGGASAAPEGEFSRVSDWVLSTTTATIATVTAAVASGDTYGITTGEYPLDMLISAINDELVKHKVVRYDRTSLDVISNTSEYTLPAGIRQDNLLNVYEETDTDTSDSNPVPLNFDVQTAATGSQQKLVIESKNVRAGNDLMLEYTAFLAPLYLATDVIDDSLPMARILDQAAASALAIAMKTGGTVSKLDIQLMQWFRADAVIAKQENQIRKPSKRGKVNEAAGD